MAKKSTPSDKRETALSEMLGRLGASKNQDERYNNGFAHWSLAVHSSYARAHDKRMGNFIKEINITIREAVIAPDLKEEDKKKADPSLLIGKTILIDRPIFEYDFTLTRWVENFYQESPSINARARDDQREIGTQAFKTPAITGFSSWGTEEQEIKPDESS